MQATAQQAMVQRHSAAASLGVRPSAGVNPARGGAAGLPGRPSSAAAPITHDRPRQHRLAQRLCVRASTSEGSASTLTAPIPTRLNTIPHERSTRQYFYRDLVAAVLKTVAAGEKRMVARCTIPELNTEFDVYRIGTLLELVREVATALAADGRTVKVCVQQALGQGVFQGMPLSLNGVMRIMNQMDWGEAKDRIKLGNLGAAEVEGADAFVLISPQNIVGHSVIPLLEEMAEAAGAAGKPLVLINPKLGDIQSAGGVMSVRGRQDRLDFTSTFVTAYHFRLLYKSVMMHPIMGALRHEYGGPWEVFRRVELGPGKEEYQPIGSFETEPKPPQITEAFKAAWAKAASC